MCLNSEILYETRVGARKNQKSSKEVCWQKILKTPIPGARERNIIPLALTCEQKKTLKYKQIIFLFHSEKSRKPIIQTKIANNCQNKLEDGSNRSCLRHGLQAGICRQPALPIPSPATGDRSTSNTHGSKFHPRHNPNICVCFCNENENQELYLQFFQKIKKEKEKNWRTCRRQKRLTNLHDIFGCGSS